MQLPIRPTSAMVRAGREAFLIPSTDHLDIGSLAKKAYRAYANSALHAPGHLDPVAVNAAAKVIARECGMDHTFGHEQATRMAWKAIKVMVQANSLNVGLEKSNNNSNIRVTHERN